MNSYTDFLKLFVKLRYYIPGFTNVNSEEDYLLFCVTQEVLSPSSNSLDFEKAYESGKAMTIEQAIALALED